MANILLRDEEKTALVLANSCVAFAVLAAYSPVTSRPYLMAAATALGLLSFYPLFLILQRPRRFMVVKETEGDKSVFILRYKGFLWWYNAKDRKGDAIVFNTLEEAQKYIKENVVTMLISDKMRRKSLKREFKVIMDSKKMNQNTESPPAGSSEPEQQQRKDAAPTPQPEATPPEEEEREEIIPDNDAAIAGLLAMGKANQDENQDEEEEEQGEKAEADEKKEVALQKQQDFAPSEKEAPSEEGMETQDGNEEENEQGDPDDPFDSRYPVPVDAPEEVGHPHEDAPDDGQDNGSDGPVDPIDADTFNEQLFDVIDSYNKSANHKKPSPKPSQPAPAPDEKPPEAGPLNESMVTTSEIVEDQALVHAHNAETVKDALGKILFHQQMVEKNEEKKNEEKRAEEKKSEETKRNEEKKTTIIPVHPNTQVIPKSKTKSKRHRDKSPDGIPTKSIQYRPSSEETLLKKQKKKQLSLLDEPGFVEDEDKTHAGNTEHPKTQQTVPVGERQQVDSEADAAEKDDSSGGPKMVKKLQDADPTPSPAKAEAPTTPDDNVSEEQNAVFTNGSENQEEEPQDDENGTILPL